MLQWIIDALFSCNHSRTTFPMTPGTPGKDRSTREAETYVACLDCGRELAYDWGAMRVGKPTKPGANP